MDNYSSTFNGIIQGYAGKYGYQWNLETIMTFARYDNASGTINNKIYGAGGQGGSEKNVLEKLWSDIRFMDLKK